MAKSRAPRTKVGEHKYLYLNGVANRDLVLAFMMNEKIEQQKKIDDGTRTEKLLPAILSFVGKRIPQGIIVAQGGGSYTQARLMVATVNALAYAWQRPVAVVTAQLSVGQVALSLTRLKWSNLATPRYRGPGVG